MCNAISMLNDRSEVGAHRIAGYIDGLNDILSTIERLSEISSTTAAAVEEQGAATQEISRNVQQAAQGTPNGYPQTSWMCSVARRIRDRHRPVLSEARLLSSDSSRLRIEVSKFLNSVRTA